MSAVETIEHESGVVAKIYQDEDPRFADPRDHDNLGVMYCWHPHYELGDEQFSRNDHLGIEEVFDYCVDKRKAIEIIPLFLLDHSGISIRSGTPIDLSNGLSPENVRATNRFIGDEAGWDTSWVGFIFATEERRNELGAPREDVVKQLQGEVEEYDLYLRGEVYYVVVEDADGDNIESCGGFLGWTYTTEEAERMLEEGVEQAQREKSERQFWLEREVVTV